MICLECHVSMEVIQHRGLEIDRCVDCGAFWFDMTEARKYLREATAGRVMEQCEPEGPRTHALVCPKCSVPTVRPCSYEGIVFSRCGDCGGLFVGADALADIVASAQSEPPPKSDATALTPRELIRIFMR
jgi:Zn-finger nucleic acid-binding protein